MIAYILAAQLFTFTLDSSANGIVTCRVTNGDKARSFTGKIDQNGIGYASEILDENSFAVLSVSGKISSMTISNASDSYRALDLNAEGAQVSKYGYTFECGVVRAKHE